MTRATPAAGFVLDLGRCVGCGACVLACRIENGWSAARAWRRILPVNLARRAGGATYTFSLACHHCDRPACLRACPSGAYEKVAGGAVIHHEERCLGCRYCEMACPFGAPQFDPPSGVVGKCHACAHRVAAGDPPACVQACPTRALLVPSDAAGRAGEPVTSVPGFADEGDCRPNLRFISPRGARRLARMRRMEEAEDR